MSLSVIILLVPRDELRIYMLRAHELGLTGGDYQFLFTDTKVIVIIFLCTFCGIIVLFLLSSDNICHHNILLD